MPSDAEKERDAWRGVIATICCDGGHYHKAHGTAATKEHCIRRVVADRTRADAAEHERDALKARVAELERERDAADRLRTALQEIADASPIPDEWEPVDGQRDYADYPEWWEDGIAHIESVDPSNPGDVHAHGRATGEWTQSKRARAALREVAAQAEEGG